MSLVAASASLGLGVTVWEMTKIMERASIGAHCKIGSNVYIGPGVSVGAGSKIQNGAQIYDPAKLGLGVFVGPGAVLTNDRFPRSLDSAGRSKDRSGWDTVGVEVGDGASIGANATCVAPLSIGAWALVGAGAVVTSDVKPYSIVLGVPATHRGWVGEAGHPLVETKGFFVCPTSSQRYGVTDGFLHPISETSA